jgi:thioredoxin 1
VTELEDLLRHEERLVLVEFWTRGCEPCRELRRRLGDLAERRGDVRVAAVAADDEPEAVARRGVSVFPTLVFFKRGRELHRLKGGALPESTLGLLGEPL